MVTVFVSIFSASLSEVFSEMTTMANGLPEAISPSGFRVMSVESRVRDITGSEQPDEEVYAKQLEIELTVEPTA